jgi:hypothetical protein
MNDDQDLRSRFAALRQLDGATVPDVDAIVARRPTRRPRRVLLPATIAAAAAIVLIVAGVRFTASEPSVSISVSPAEPSILAWRSPTASLLQTPGRELLQTTPTVESALLRSLP